MVWEREMVWDERSHVMAMLSVNLVGPKSVTSHWDSRKVLNEAVSSGEDAAEKMLLTCREKTMVPVGDWWRYTHHLHRRHSNPYAVTALLKVMFQIQLACFIP